MIASRFVEGATVREPALRRGLSRALNRVFRRGLSLGVRDLSSATRLVRRNTLAARYDALGTLAPGTFGRQFWEIYKRNGYAFPGQEQGVNARFATPHDSTHVLSGYDTSPQGEILVSTFTAGMHPRLPMEGHILPVIFSWHLGIEINAFAKSARNQLDVEKFWVAWVRGSEMRTDLFAPDWDFWNLIEEPVAAVQSRYQVPGLAPRHAAGHHPLSIED